MKGAIFFSTKYGSREQNAQWIGESTGLPVFNIKDANADLSEYDFLLLGSLIIYYKIHFHKWMKSNWVKIENKPVILFTVSGAPAGEKLNAWIENRDRPKTLISKMNHVALQGRQKPEELTWYDWIMLRIRAMQNKDPKAREEELKGFDYMVKLSIEPIVKWFNN